MERFLCIHGHFYQPPRENPWLEAVELQDSAYPYHDWNERVTDECYAPNGVTRIMDGKGRIADIVNNYSRISFNFGPTLLQWLELHRPEAYQAILDADRMSAERFSGHGSAMAQAYNHVIMPLANARDKETQVVWGIEDFRHRFGRDPEGMWLPETAVDLESLDVMAARGIRFTVLAPRQAEAVRKKGAKDWKDVSGAKVEPRRPYEVQLPSGRTITVFFYDGPMSRTVAFEDVLSNGERFADRLANLFTDNGEDTEIVHIATDGETYGHHHRYGDMALAYALRHVESNKLARLTNYAEFLELHPPEWEARIVENTSWSCAHGIERWRSDCGCHTGGQPGWNQAWREPLREALDYLRDELWGLYDDKARMLLDDPVAARDDYINVVLDRTPENVDAFLARHAGQREMDETARVVALKLLEMQRHAILMYTSCGWFFNDLSGIETVQVIQYAGRAIQLAQDLSGRSIETTFLSRLEAARSNIPSMGDGRALYDKFVRPAMVDLLKVGAHYGISSLFEGYEKRDKVYCFWIDRDDHYRAEAGRSSLAVGRARIISEITGETQLLTYGALHMGDHNMSAGVREFLGDDQYAEMLHEVVETFERAEFPEIIRLFEKHFGTATYSLRSLFRDEQRKISDVVLENALERAAAIQQDFYDNTLPMMRFLASVGIPIPKVFYFGAEFVINSGLRAALEETELDMERIDSLIEEANLLHVTLDQEGLSFTMQNNLENDMEELTDRPIDLDLLERATQKAILLRHLPFEVNLWKVQNDYFTLRRDHAASMSEAAVAGSDEARQWIGGFRTLGEALYVRTD